MDCHGNRCGGRRDGCSAKEREASLRKISLFGGCICISWNAGKLQWSNESLEKATCTRRLIPFIYLMGTLLFQLGRNPAFGPVTFTGRIHCTAGSGSREVISHLTVQCYLIVQTTYIQNVNDLSTISCLLTRKQQQLTLSPFIFYLTLMNWWIDSNKYHTMQMLQWLFVSYLNFRFRFSILDYTLIYSHIFVQL